tara:strand:+ start:412 stop:594 length:183 start_codon:yes stop_codon:yes gene_type:complete
MPFYTFRCGKCSKSLEILTKSDDREDRMCPKCGCAMRRQFPKPARPGSKDGSWGFGGKSK